MANHKNDKTGPAVPSDKLDLSELAEGMKAVGIPTAFIGFECDDKEMRTSQLVESRRVILATLRSRGVAISQGALDLINAEVSKVYRAAYELGLAEGRGERK